MKKTKIFPYKVLLISFLVVVIFIAASWVYLEKQVQKQFPEKAIKSKLQEWIRTSPVAISYDGFSVNAWYGLRIFNVKISAEKDFARGKIFLKAREVRIPPEWTSAFGMIAKKKLSYYRVHIYNANINVYADERKILPSSRKFLQQAFCKLPPVRLYLEGKGTIHWAEKGYKKFYKEIPKLRVNANMVSERSNFQIDFQDGSQTGVFKVSQIACKKEIPQWSKAAFQFRIQNFSLKSLNDYFTKYRAEKGTASFSIEKPNKKQEYWFQGELNQVYLTSDQNTVELSHFLTKGIYTKSKKQIYLKASGEMEKHHFVIQYEGHPRFQEEWPTFLFVELTGNPKNKIPLMNGYELYGLSSLRFSMDEPLKEKYLYRSLYGSLQMENGKIQSQQKEFANHIQVNFTMSENKYSLNFFGDILKAQVSLDAKGEFRIIPSSYSYVAYPYGDNRTVGITEKLRLFAGDHTAKLKVRGDTRLLLESLSKKITSSYMEALWKGMQETGNQQLAYHTSFYRQFLLRPSVSLSVQVHSQEGFPLQANLLLQNGILQTEVKDLRQNQFKLYASFQNEMPFWQWSLQHKNGFSKWIQKAIPKELISQAKNIQLSYDAKTYGRRPVEWYQNQQGEGQIQMMDLKLGKSFLEKKVSPNWDTLEATFKRIAEKTWINPIRAENRYEVLTGYARIIEKYLNPEIFVSTYTIRKP